MIIEAKNDDGPGNSLRITRKVTIEENMELQGERRFWYIVRGKDIFWRSIGVAIFVTVFIIELFWPTDGIVLEYLYRFHIILLLSILAVFLLREVFLVAQMFKKDISSSTKHIMWGIIFIALWSLSWAGFEKVVSPKLTTVRIKEPKDNSRVSLHVTETKVFVRKIK
jgi:energy-coupling factor transporter transmembrane protein EcfT